MTEVKEISTSQTEPTWWHSLVICPVCSSSLLSWPDDSSWKGECRECGTGFYLKNNVLHWDELSQPDIIKILPLLARRVRSLFNPISTPLLPFRYLSKFRIERYYSRTLQDTSLASKWASHYLDGLDLPKGATVLDFGCGRGRNIGMLNNLGYRVVGQDIVGHHWWGHLIASGFQVVRESSNIPLRDDVVDLVTEVGVIHYINEASLLKHIQEVKRILRPGGYWLLLEGNSTSYGASEMIAQIGQLHELDKIRQLTVDCGFVELSQSYEGFYAPYFPIAINFIRKICNPLRFDPSDYDSWLAAKIRPERRGLWLLRLKRSDK